MTKFLQPIERVRKYQKPVKLTDQDRFEMASRASTWKSRNCLEMDGFIAKVNGNLLLRSIGNNAKQVKVRWLRHYAHAAVTEQHAGKMIDELFGAYSKSLDIEIVPCSIIAADGK